MSKPYQPLYTPEQRKRRDLSVWTWIQGVLAPIQFLVFLVSITLVIRYLVTGEDYQLDTKIRRKKYLYGFHLLGPHSSNSQKIRPHVGGR